MTKPMTRSNKLLVLGTAALMLTLLAPPASLAQSQEPQKPTTEVQQLKERLGQLEQTVEELKAALKAVEGSQKAAGTATATGDRIATPTNSAPTTSTAPTSASAPGATT